MKTCSLEVIKVHAYIDHMLTIPRAFVCVCLAYWSHCPIERFCRQNFSLSAKLCFLTRRKWRPQLKPVCFQFRHWKHGLISQWSKKLPKHFKFRPRIREQGIALFYYSVLKLRHICPVTVKPRVKTETSNKKLEMQFLHKQDVNIH